MYEDSNPRLTLPLLRARASLHIFSSRFDAINMRRTNLKMGRGSEWRLVGWRNLALGYSYTNKQCAKRDW